MSQHCGNCGVEVGPTDRHCGSCGHPVEAGRPPRPAWLFPAAAVTVIAVMGWWLTSGRAATPPLTSGGTTVVTATAVVTATVPSTVVVAPPAPARPPTVAPPAAAAYPSIHLPITAKVCGSTAGGPYAQVATGNESTSCPFALNVQTAYIQAGGSGAPIVVNAYSPVTTKWYSMSCSGYQPVTCTGGVAAIVVLFGGAYTFE